MNTRWHDLIVDRIPDGGVHLEQQSGCEEPNVIHLHPAQLRHIAETFGLVAPNYPADELAKRLAYQLCATLKGLEDECHRSHWLELTYAKLDAWCSAIPDELFPYDLWEDEPEAMPKAQKPPVTPSNAVANPKASTPPAITPSDDGQLGLAV